MIISWFFGLIQKVKIARLRKNGLKIGVNCHIAGNALLDPTIPRRITIGNDCTITSNVMIFAHDASTVRHLGYSRHANVTIGNKVFIGAGAIILPGVHIGDNSIIGAGTVVRHNIPANSVVIGNPMAFKQTIQDFTAKHTKISDDTTSYYRRRSPKKKRKF